jgi:ABC-type transporter Mla subunit MlaD
MLVAALVVGGIVLVVCLLLGAWILAPSLRMFGRPDFEPTYENEALVDKAQNNNTIGGGGASAGM